MIMIATSPPRQANESIKHPHWHASGKTKAVSILMGVLCLAFQVRNNHFELNNDDDVRQLLIEFSDSSKVKEVLGVPDEVDVHSRHINTIVGCVSSYWYTMTYRTHGMVVTNSREMDPDKVNYSTIEIDTNSTWRIKGIQCNRSRFGDLDGMEGHWARWSGEKNDAFGFVTKYVIYHTPWIHVDTIDSLGLDLDDRKIMDDHFKLEKIEMMTLGDNEGLLDYLGR